MTCPNCGSRNYMVEYTFEKSDGIRRRRKCLNCNRKFITYERIEKMCDERKKRKWLNTL